MKPKTIKGKHILVLLAVAAAILLLWPKPAPKADATGSGTDAGCSISDPIGSLGKLIGNPTDCVNSIKGSGPY